MKRFLLTVIAIFVATGGSAQGVVRVDSVVVRASGERPVVPTQSLDRQSLTHISSGSVAEVLRFFSGVQIKDYGGIGGLKTVDVHGLGSQHTGVFFDGIAVGNAQNGVVDLGRFSLDNVDAVSLAGGGGGGSIFVSARQLASSSALFVKTRRPVFENGERSLLRATLKAGSFATINPSLVWDRRLGARVNGSLSAEGLYSSGKYRFRYAREGGWDTVGVRTNGDIRLARIEGSLFGDIQRDARKTGEWDAKVYFYTSERGYPGAVIKRAAGVSLPPDDREKDLSFFAQSSVRQRFSNFYSLRTQAKMAHDDTRYNSQAWRQTEMYASAANLFTLTRCWTAALSADIQYNTLAAAGSAMLENGFSDPSRLTVLSAASTVVELPRFSAKASVLWTGARDLSDGGGSNTAPNRSVFSPSVAAAWMIGGGLSARALFKKSFRLPTFNDLYYNDLGNRALRPEFTVQWSAGLAFRRENVSASVDAYINNVRDKIVATPTANQFSWTMLNLGRVEIRGVDAVVDGRFQVGVARFSARAAYTFQDFSRGDAVPYLPRHSGSFLASATWGAARKEWSASWNTILTGRRYRLGSQTVANLLAPWHTHDFSLSRVFGAAKFTAQINNIFNRRYEVVRWYPMPGTNIKLIITITL